MANTLTFASVTLTDADIYGGISFTHDLNTGDEFTIGNTASASVKFVTETQLPLYTKDQTNGVFTWTQDSVSRGTYYITEVTKADGKYDITAYDAISLLDVNISALSISFPATVSGLASVIAAYIGCTVSGTIVNGSLAVNSLDADMSVRQLLGYIAEASGCSVKIDGANHLCFMYYADSGITLTASDYVKIEVADYTCAAIDNVTIYNSQGEIQASYGSGGNSLFIGQNPFLEYAADSNAYNIYSKVHGLVYAPVRCDLFDESGLEVGTIATFGTTATLIMHIESSESGATASSVGSDSRAAYNKSVVVLANEAKAVAIDAQAVASAAAGLLTDMQAAAAAAGTTLEGIYQDAEDAKQTADEINAYAEVAGETVTQILTDAGNAYASANNAQKQLSIVEDVIGTLQWVSQHGHYVLSEDDAVIPTKTYYTVTGVAIASPTGNPSRNGYYELVNDVYVLSTDTSVDSQKTYYQVTGTVVESPTGDPSTSGYYELEIDEAIQQYINTHLALTDSGLSVTDGSRSSVLISTDGVTIYGSNGQVIGQYGEGAIIGDELSYHIEITGSELAFCYGARSQGHDNRVAYMTDQKLYIPMVVVTQSMQAGNWLWDASVDANHFTLKYIGA